MRYVAAYLLATIGGNAAPSADDVKAILASVGIDADAEKLNKVCRGTARLLCLNFMAHLFFISNLIYLLAGRERAQGQGHQRRAR